MSFNLAPDELWDLGQVFLPQSLSSFSAKCGWRRIWLKAWKVLQLCFCLSQKETKKPVLWRMKHTSCEARSPFPRPKARRW